MAKKQVEQLEGEAEGVKEAPEYSDAQLFKMKTLKEKDEKESAKRKAVLDKVKEESANYKPDLRGTWLPYVEKSGMTNPGMVIAERFKQEGEELKLVLTLYVFSPNTAVPYKAELTY